MGGSKASSAAGATAHGTAKTPASSTAAPAAVRSDVSLKAARDQVLRRRGILPPSARGAGAVWAYAALHPQLDAELARKSLSILTIGIFCADLWGRANFFERYRVERVINSSPTNPVSMSSTAKAARMTPMSFPST